MPNPYARKLAHADIIAMSQAAQDKKRLKDLHRSGDLDGTFMGSVAHHADIQRKATSGDPAAVAVGAAVGAGLYAARKTFSGIRGIFSKSKPKPTASPTPGPTGSPSPSPSPAPGPTGSPSPSPSPSPAPGPSGSSRLAYSTSTPKKSGVIAKLAGLASQIKGRIRARFTKAEEYQMQNGYESLRMRLAESVKKNTKKKEGKEESEEELEESAPANSVGGGENIAGINPPAGGSPTQAPKKKKKKVAAVSSKSLHGIAAGKTVSQLAKIHGVSAAHIRHQLAKGVRIEREHTANGAVARKIAMDHLMEDPNYYSNLSKVEKGKEIRAKNITKQREKIAAEKLKKKQKLQGKH